MGLTRTTTAYKKINSVKSKIVVVQGGMSASKNYSIAQILLRYALEKPRIISVTTDTYDNLKDGSILDFKDRKSVV